MNMNDFKGSTSPTCRGVVSYNPPTLCEALRVLKLFNLNTYKGVKRYDGQ